MATFTRVHFGYGGRLLIGCSPRSGRGLGVWRRRPLTVVPRRCCGKGTALLAQHQPVLAEVHPDGAGESVIAEFFRVAQHSLQQLQRQFRSETEAGLVGVLCCRFLTGGVDQLPKLVPTAVDGRRALLIFACFLEAAIP